MKRKKLYNGAIINHSYLGKVVIKITHRNNTLPPDLWQANHLEASRLWKIGELACPYAYSEEKLHSLLEFDGTYVFVENGIMTKILNLLERK